MRKLIISGMFIISLISSGCASQGMNGAGIGALGGAAAGALLTKNKILGGAIGAGGVALLGLIVGNEIDKHNMRKAMETLETKPTGSVTQWSDPNSGRVFQAVPQQPRYDAGGYVYRDMIITSNTGEHIVVRCRRNPDGSWTVVHNEHSALARNHGIPIIIAETARS